MNSRGSPGMKDDYMIVLDYLPQGKPGDPRRLPIVQGIGTQSFSLLEAYPKLNAVIGLLEKVYIGKGERDKISQIVRRIRYEDLTTIAKDNLYEAVKNIVKENEDRFVDLINRAGPITIRLHSLELLPGVGKKHLIKILDEREKEPFKSLLDLKNRVKLTKDPYDMITERIIEEIKGNVKYYLFVKPPRVR